jgi:NAD(P)-dependent dehydrogenase (short-subunit alcohol dehydrogenase family)
LTRTVLITGATGGIGQATVSEFVEAGWQAFAVDKIASDKLPREAIFHQADVADDRSVRAFFEWLSDRTKKLDALVNNAAIQISKPLIETSIDEWDLVLATNLRSVFLTARYGFGLLKRAQGAVVNVSSVHALVTSTDIAAYAASKGGLAALSRAMALEWAEEGIRVNSVLPGAIDTPMLRAGLDRRNESGGSADEQVMALAGRTPLGRVGTTDEIAKAILFLADGTESSFMTGQALVVDGGASARLSTE